MLEFSRENIATEQPIWDSVNAELYSSSPGLERYVIWSCVPSDDSVRKFPRFDNLDQLPHHYYQSFEEYEQARHNYVNGVYPDKLIDLNIFASREDKLVKSHISEVAIFDPNITKDTFTDHLKAA